MNPKIVEEISDRIESILRQTPVAEIGQNVRAALSASLARLDLVTREEFDIQAQVLARTREKLAALEARVAALESDANARR